MNTPEQTILGLLQDQEDPLTRSELADCSGFTETEVLKALGELSKTHNISKTIAGYKLAIEGAAAAYVATQNDDLRELLTFFTGHNKAFLPKTLREALDWDKKRITDVLATGKQLGIVTPKNNGTYYLTPLGVQYIIKHYPDIKVKAFVLDKAKEQTTHFQIVAPHIKAVKEQQEKATKLAKQQPHPAIAQARKISVTLKLTEKPISKLPKLTEVPVKIQVLDELALCFGNDVQIQLQQLSGFLREYARG